MGFSVFPIERVDAIQQLPRYRRGSIEPVNLEIEQEKYVDGGGARRVFERVGFQKEEGWFQWQALIDSEHTDEPVYAQVVADRTGTHPKI